MTKILIIEDDPAILNSYTYIFSKNNFEVYSANHALKGMELALEQKPDVILLDMLMPEFSGLDYLRRLEPAKNLPDTKIIVMSNTESPHIIEEAAKLGAIKYLLKVNHTPYTLVDAVNAIIDNPQT